MRSALPVLDLSAMTWRAIALLGRRMARRNHLYLFAWLSALLVPTGLQVVAGSVEDIRDWLVGYYGPLTLYMFFALAYGFACVFVAYYQTGAYRRTGALDMLRVTRANPAQVVLGAFYQIEHVLVPPQIAFMTLFMIYARFFSADRFLVDAGVFQVLAFASVLILSQMLLAALQLTSLFRREETTALLCAVLVLPLSSGMIAFTMIARLPAWLYLVFITVATAALLAVAWHNVRVLWPPQRGERRGT